MESRGTGEHSQVSTASRKCSAAREQGCGQVPVLVGLLILVLKYNFINLLDVLEYLIGENAKYLYLYLIQSTW